MFQLARVLIRIALFVAFLPEQAPASDELGKRISALHRRAEETSPGGPSARRLAEEIRSVARLYLDRGDAGRAIELDEEAYGWDPENGLVLAELTLAYVRTENFGFARVYLELAEQMAPRAPPEAYAVLGDVYESLHRLEDAVLSWEQFERLGGEDPRVLKRFARAREELSLSTRQKLQDAGHFQIYYDASIPGQIVEKLEPRLENSYHELSDFFGTAPSGPQIIILYAGRAYFTLASVPDWVSGVYDGKIRVCLGSDGGVTSELEAVLSHELSHAFLRHASKGHAPAWLHEGFAQWWEGKRIPRSEFRAAFQGVSSAALTQLEGSLRRAAGRAEARSGYAEALLLTEYLVESRGIGSLACFVRDLADGVSLEEALRREAGVSSAELVMLWRSWARL